MFALLLASTLAVAQDFERQDFERQDVESQDVESQSDLRLPRFGLRAGADARPDGDDTGPGRPVLCGEYQPWRRVGFEACGNGAGFLHQAQVTDMAHFRVRGMGPQWRRARSDLTLLGGVGFAEVQSTADALGFRFGAASEGQVEAAGAEAAIGLRGQYWMGDRSALVLDITVGSAHIPGAPEVVGTPGPWVPFGSLTAGIGF